MGIRAFFIAPIALHGYAVRHIIRAMSATSLEKPVIAVIGAGAVGGYYGARLAQHGYDVHFLLRSDYESVRQNGWTIQSRDGDFSLAPDQVHVYRDPRDMPQADLVLIALKATANDHYEELIRPLLKEDTVLLTLQNGLGNEDRLADLFGAHRIVGGLAFVCLNRVSPGHIAHTDHGMIRLGEFRGGPSPRVQRLAELFAASQIPCRILDSLLYGRWEKLLWNIPFNGLGAALDLATDALIATPAGEALVRSIMQEVSAAAAAYGVIFPPDLIDRQIQNTRTMGPYKSSMQIDRETGRALEVDAILGRPLAAAQAASVPTSRLEMLDRLLRLIDPAAHDVPRDHAAHPPSRGRGARN